MCKILSSVSTFNMYASVFFLTAMSVARYCSVACSNRPARCLLPTPCPCSSSSSYPLAPSAPCWASLGVWALSLAATLPHAIYSTTVRLSERDELCLVRFPDSGGGWDPQLLLGLYQTQKVLLGFVIPLVIISVCYLLLLRFVRRRRGGGRVEEGAGKRDKGHGGRSRQSKRRSKVTRSVAIVVLAFFLCWLPNQALTLWGVLIKFDLLPFSKAFYNAQAYAFPLSVCLAHANSCLNPVLYCLVRPEFRSGLKQLLLRAKPPRSTLVILRPRKQKVAPPPAHSEPPPCPAPPAVALDGRD
ncbi:RL3R1 protein, partial [Amia calva]|nr:RL3R1 protein [Amia calva]